MKIVSRPLGQHDMQHPSRITEDLEEEKREDLKKIFERGLQ